MTKAATSQKKKAVFTCLSFDTELRVGETDADEGLLYVISGNKMVMLHNRGSAAELAKLLQHYSETGHLGLLARCPQCRRKQLDDQAVWTETIDGRKCRCHGSKCTNCGYRFFGGPVKPQ